MPSTRCSAVSCSKFQSTPANTGGRCQAPRFPPGFRSRFNPRPPILAGDAGAGSACRLDHPVSIHARQYWRAMRCTVSGFPRVHLFQSTPANTGGRCASTRCSAVSCSKFQSTPANTGGRCTGCRGLASRSRWKVSIHARQYWRAMRSTATRSSARWLFQSTPANTGGRCSWPRSPPRFAGGFNPRPPILAGDAPEGGSLGVLSGVSIHARQYWRAMRAAGCSRHSRRRFQSTPANTGGRCGGALL